MATFREAVVEDGGVVANLLSELGYPTPKRQAEQRIAQFAASTRDEVLVAVEAQGVVGLCSWSVLPMFAEEGWLARLTALVVAEHAQGRGIGTRLVTRAEERAASAGCVIMQVSSGRRPARDAAHAFYPSQGYHDTGQHHVLYAKGLGA